MNEQKVPGFPYILITLSILLAVTLSVWLIYLMHAALSIISTLVILAINLLLIKLCVQFIPAIRKNKKKQDPERRSKNIQTFTFSIIFLCFVSYALHLLKTPYIIYFTTLIGVMFIHIAQTLYNMLTDKENKNRHQKKIPSYFQLKVIMFGYVLPIVIDSNFSTLPLRIHLYASAIYMIIYICAIFYLDRILVKSQ